MTATMPDILIHRGQRLALCATPLETYFRVHRRSRRPRFLLQNTACRRGYVATWEIRDGMLYLNHIEGELQCGRKTLTFKPADIANVLSELTPPIAATWVSDQLRCPEGRLRNYSHHAFASDYERDRLFNVVCGVVEGEWLRLNPPDPVCYRINLDGSRTRFEGLWGETDELPDPFPPDQTPKGHVIWGQPEPDEEQDEGYVLGGYAQYGRPFVR